MANSLRTKISKLRHDGNITNEEYQELISKLDGHDKQVREDAIIYCLKHLKENHKKYGKVNYIQAIEDLEQLKENK